MKNLFTYVLLLASVLTTAQSLRAQDGPDPGDNPNKELLQDEFLYEFSGNRPIKWTVVGDPELLSGRDTYNSNTGYGLRIIAVGDEGKLEQIITMGDQGTAGDVFEGLLHYCVDEGPSAGALRLEMQWLNASDNVITSETDKRFVDNTSLWFSMPRTWGTLRFRTKMPAGAVRFRFAIRTAAFSNVRLDDFSFRKQSPPLTPFISILPQVRPAHELEIGQTAEHKYIVQSYGLETDHEIKISDNVPFTANLTKIDRTEGSRELIVTCKPTVAGKFPRGTSTPSALTINVDDKRTLSLPLRAYAIDPSNPPTMSIDPATFETLSYEQGSTIMISKELQLRFANMIDDVTIAITTGKGFSTNNTTVRYFEKAYPNLGINVGVNNSTVKVQYRNPQAPVGFVDATLTLTSPMAKTVTYPVRVQIKASAEGWIEKFSSRRKPTGERYADIEAQKYFIYDRGAWRTEGNTTIDDTDHYAIFYGGDDKLYFEGTFRDGGIFNEDFVAGISTINVTAGDAFSTAAQLAVEVSYDHGATWLRPAPAQKVTSGKKMTFAVNTHQPTSFRLVRTNAGGVDDAFIIKSVQVEAAPASGRIVLPTLLETLDFTGETPKAILSENFDGKLHHGALSVPGWRNYSFSGNRPWVAFKQTADDSKTGKMEDVAKVTLYNSTRQNEKELTAHLVSPLLSYTNATTKELTFRLYKQTQTEGDLFYVYVAPVKDGKVTQFLQLPLDLVTPGDAVSERTWFDYLIDLSLVPELVNVKDFVVVYSLQTPLDGNQTSTVYLIDDFSWGQTNNPKIEISKPFAAFYEQAAGIRSEEQHYTVTATNAREHIRTLIYSTNTKVFEYEPTVLPAQGGEVIVTAKPERNTEYAGRLYFTTRGGGHTILYLFSTPKTEQQVIEESVDDPAQPNAYAYRQGGTVVVNAPELQSVEAFSLTGERLARAEATGAPEVSLDIAPTVAHPVLVLHYTNGRRQTIKL